MHQQRSKKIFIYFFLFLIIGTLNNKNFNNINFTKINKINVAGLGKENNLELTKKLNFLKISNIFFLNKLEIADIIDSNNLVEKYSVFKKYPSTLNIEIDKTKFLAQVKKNGNFYFLGTNGKLIKTKTIKKNIPLIIGQLDNKSFLELKKIIDETNFNYNQIKNLIFFKSGRWDIQTKSGVIIKLPKTDLKKSLELLIQILEKNDFKEINKIDLRQKKQVIING